MQFKKDYFHLISPQKLHLQDVLKDIFFLERSGDSRNVFSTVCKVNVVKHRGIMFFLLSLLSLPETKLYILMKRKEKYDKRQMETISSDKF